MDKQALVQRVARLEVDLHPSRSCDALDGVREELNAQLLKWSDTLNGVLVAYAEERIVSTQATIHPYFPYIHVHVSARVLVFAPRAGCSLSGKVNKVDADYIGLLVLDVFNAAIGRQNIRSEYTFRIAGECWASRQDAKAIIREGSTVHFEVIKVQDEGGYFSLLGSLQQPWSGASSEPDPPAAAAAAAAALAVLSPDSADVRATAVAALVAVAAAAPAAAAQAAQEGGGAAVAGATSKPEERKKSRKGSAAAAPAVVQYAAGAASASDRSGAPAVAAPAAAQESGCPAEAMPAAAAAASAAVAEVSVATGAPQEKKKKRKKEGAAVGVAEDGDRLHVRKKKKRSMAEGVAGVPNGGGPGVAAPQKGNEVKGGHAGEGRRDAPQPPAEIPSRVAAFVAQSVQASAAKLKDRKRKAAEGSGGASLHAAGPGLQPQQPGGAPAPAAVANGPIAHRKEEKRRRKRPSAAPGDPDAEAPGTVQAPAVPDAAAPAAAAPGREGATPVAEPAAGKKERKKKRKAAPPVQPGVAGAKASASAAAPTSREGSEPAGPVQGRGASPVPVAEAVSGSVTVQHALANGAADMGAASAAGLGRANEKKKKRQEARQSVTVGQEGGSHSAGAVGQAGDRNGRQRHGHAAASVEGAAAAAELDPGAEAAKGSGAGPGLPKRAGNSGDGAAAGPGADVAAGKAAKPKEKKRR